MAKSLTKARIKKVFDGTMANIANGKAPNVSNEMLKAGYSPNSAKAMKITFTKVWQDLLRDVDDEGLLGEIKKIAFDNEDKRAKLQAIDMLLKLKDKYPAGKMKIGAFDERDQVVEEAREAIITEVSPDENT